MEEDLGKSACDESTLVVQSDSEDESSDSDLEIDFDQILIPQRTSSPILLNENDIIETLKHEIGKQIEAKAEKTNLTVTNVKTIIRQILTHEHVKALIVNGQECEKVKELVSLYEPKLTRSKAKELLSSTTIKSVPPPPWVPQPPTSETHVLIGEDLKEDDSGDEYVPGEESEDDNNESAASESDTSSLPPPTPPTPVSMEDSSTQTTNWTDDGVFKIPPPKTDQEDIPNIALRTRSKINLSSTPLEAIEQSFVPPDITTDMYDMECDDDVWKEFLKGFTQPLEEVARPTDDEEQDPEYNILADDEINIVDREDFRVDKAVKITKKEIKQLWDELFDYLRDLSEDYGDQTIKENSENTNLEQGNQMNESLMSQQYSGVFLEQRDSVEQTLIPVKQEVIIEQQQICILEQQVRQHVQMLTQNFILSYEHPEYHNLSSQFHEYLLNLKMLSDGKDISLFKPMNLKQALELIDEWVKLFATNTCEVQATRDHVTKELIRCIQMKMAGNSSSCILTFPKLVLETILNSQVFLYPALLPKIPFKSDQFFGPHAGFTDAEDRLLVFGLAEFTKFLEEEKHTVKISLKEKVQYIHDYMMPHKDPQYIIRHINQTKHPRCATNPIQQYFLHGRIRPVIHYIYPLNQAVAPSQRLADELPYQWRNFVYPNYDKNKTIKVNNPTVRTSNLPQVFFINSPFLGSPILSSPIFSFNSSQRRTRNTSKLYNQTPRIRRQSCRKVLNRSFNSVDQFIAVFKQPVCVQKLIHFLAEIEPEESNSVPKEVFLKEGKHRPSMLSMPSLNTPAKKTSTNSDEAFTNVNRSDNVTPNNIQVNAEQLAEIEAEESNSVPKEVLPKVGKNRSSIPSLTMPVNKTPKNSDEASTNVNSSDNVTTKNTQTNVEQLAEIDPKGSNSVPKEVSPKVGKNRSSILSMPSLNTPVKMIHKNSDEVSTNVNESEKITTKNTQANAEQKSSSSLQDQKKDKFAKNLEFSTISSASFQQAEMSSEVEFYRNSSDVQICQTSQSVVDRIQEPVQDITQKQKPEKDNLEESNVSSVPTVKSNVRKEPSGAEKKKAKLRKEFVANLSIATPEDAESEKHKSEMFALAYYDKLRETLELEDYYKVIQILTEFESGDVIDLYKNIQCVLRPKYAELAEEFLYFLKEKEAAALDQLIPWMEVQARVKFCHKLEIYFKDQPAQLKKIYNSLVEFSQMEDVTLEKVKNVLSLMLKGNPILIDLFLQNFKDERPPTSLLEGPYEKLDINKELARQDDEEIYEKFVVPNTEDKYGGVNCVCHCHKIEDNEYKSRYKHCNSCGLRFIHGKVYVQSCRGMHPATVCFNTSSNSSQISRLQEKKTNISVPLSHRKKRYGHSPSKHVSTNGKEHVDEDTEDEELGKRKKSVSQKSPRKRKKTDTTKPLSPKKSPGKTNDSLDCSKDSIKPRKRTYSGKRTKKDEVKKTESEVLKKNEIIDEKCQEEEIEGEEKLEHQEDHQETDDCMDSSGESLEKPLTPGQQTAESESEIYCEESSQDNYESDSSSSSIESTKGSQSDSNTNDEPPWKREEDTIILETFQKEDDKEYALQIISDKLPHRTRDDINGRFSKLMDLLLETLKQK